MLVFHIFHGIFKDYLRLHSKHRRTSAANFPTNPNFPTKLRHRIGSVNIAFITTYMKNFCNSDWLRAVQLIPNRAILCYDSANLCCHILAGKKPSQEKQIWRPRLGEL